VCYRIKPHAPPARFSEPPIILCFSVATVLYRWNAFDFLYEAVLPLYIHCLLHGLPGYLILFAPHAFVPQRQFSLGHCLRLCSYY